MKTSILFAAMALGTLSTAFAAPFTQCPNAGANTGCAILITVTGVNGSGAATAFTVANSNPVQGPYDGADDTMIGIQNSSGAALASIFLTSNTDIFGFDGDGPCTVSPNPGNCNPAAAAFGYGGPGVTFSGINASSTSGTVNFGPSLANGGSAWFGLEEAISATAITNGTPEPSSVILMSSALACMGLLARRKLFSGK